MNNYHIVADSLFLGFTSERVFLVVLYHEQGGNSSSTYYLAIASKEASMKGISYRTGIKDQIMSIGAVVANEFLKGVLCGFRTFLSAVLS